MGRHAEAWKLVGPRNGVWYVRFRHGEGPKNRHCISTGKRDRGEATAEAARIYSAIVKGGRRVRRRVTISLEPLERLLAKWVVSISGVLDPETVTTYEAYAGGHWATFQTLDDVTDETLLAEYARARLRRVLKKTVYKELSALFGFLTWCKEQGAISELPRRPEMPKKARGTRCGSQRAVANELTVAQVEAFLTALPEWSERTHRGRRFPVRARFVFAYETGLRPSTIDVLERSHWHGATITIDDEDDKARFGREVPISKRAEAALGSVGKGEGPIFGCHDYRPAIVKACAAAGISEKVAPYDLRHARGTHLIDAGKSLTGVAYLLGHTQVTTTNKYVKPSRRAAEEAVRETVSGSIRDHEKA